MTYLCSDSSKEGNEDRLRTRRHLGKYELIGCCVLSVKAGRPHSLLDPYVLMVSSVKLKDLSSRVYLPVKPFMVREHGSGWLITAKSEKKTIPFKGNEVLS